MKIRMRILNMIPVMKITLLIKLIAMFLPDIKRLAPGDHHVSYTAYINLDLIDDGGSKVHTEYLILEKTFNFTI